MQLAEGCSRPFTDLILSRVQDHGIGRAHRRTDAAAYTPFAVYNGYAVRHPHCVNRAYSCTFSAPGAVFCYGVPHEVGCHDGITRYFSPPDVPYVPAGATATVAVMFDLVFRVIH